MKKHTNPKNRTTPPIRHKPARYTAPPPSISEGSPDTLPLSQDVPEEFRAPVPGELPAPHANPVNWSAAEDRGEDLAEERDPFMQQQERDTEIPPELIQQRAYHLYEQRGKSPNDNLADWFEAERQLRRKAP